MRFRIDRGVGYDALVTIFLVPHTAVGQEDLHCLLQPPGHRSPKVGSAPPGNAPNSRFGPAASPAWLSGGVPRCAASGSAPFPSVKLWSVCISAVGSANTASNSDTRCRWRTSMITSALRNRRSEYTFGRPRGRSGRRRGHGNAIDQLDQCDKQRLRRYHSDCLHLGLPNLYDAAAAALGQALAWPTHL